MLEPEIPATEERRLAALYSLGLLDTPDEEVFDGATRLARRLFDVPVALVSLIDDDRQWFKSKQGLTVDETPRSVSFCGHAILGHDVFVVEDATADPRFASNPLVTSDPDIRFYAGAPVRTPTGQAVGTVCIIDRHPRQFGAEDIGALADLASMVEREIAARYAAVIDDLTGLYNRRGFMVSAERLLHRADERDDRAALVFADLDGLKEVNDKLGHEAGDRAIVAAAETLRSAFDAHDPVGRLGGDEFAVLVYGPGAARAADAMEALPLTGTDRATAGCRFSHGVALRDPGGAGLDALLALADQRMYTAKRTRAMVGQDPARLPTSPAVVPGTPDRTGTT